LYTKKYLAVISSSSTTTASALQATPSLLQSGRRRGIILHSSLAFTLAAFGLHSLDVAIVIKVEEEHEREREKREAGDGEERFLLHQFSVLASRSLQLHQTRAEHTHSHFVESRSSCCSINTIQPGCHSNSYSYFFIILLY
jgi:hypothetical protein